jgi:hypothetical protein
MLLKSLIILLGVGLGLAEEPAPDVSHYSSGSDIESFMSVCSTLSSPHLEPDKGDSIRIFDALRRVD